MSLRRDALLWKAIEQERAVAIRPRRHGRRNGRCFHQRRPVAPAQARDRRSARLRDDPRSVLLELVNEERGESLELVLHRLSKRLGCIGSAPFF